MSVVVNLNVLKARFKTGDRPSNKDFVDLIDTRTAGGISGGGMTEGQSVFVGSAGNLVSKNAMNARAALGVLSAGTKAVGLEDNQVLKNDGVITADIPAMPAAAGWRSYTIDAYLAALGIGTKHMFFSSGAVPKVGTPPITGTQEITMTFARPTGATYWTEIELYGCCYLSAVTEAAAGAINFKWYCGDPLVESVVGTSSGEGCLAALAELSLADGERASINTHYIGVVPAALQQTFPLILKGLMVLDKDMSGANWNVAGKATAR